MSHGTVIGHCQPRYLVLELGWTDVGFWGQIRAFTLIISGDQLRGFCCYSPLALLLWLGQKNSFTKEMDFRNHNCKTFHSLLLNPQMHYDSTQSDGHTVSASLGILSI